MLLNLVTSVLIAFSTFFLLQFVSFIVVDWTGRPALDLRQLGRSDQLFDQLLIKVGKLTHLFLLI
jgi:hypothetical protein